MSRKSGSADPAAAMDTAADMAKAGRLKQIRMIAGLVHRSNPRALPIVFGSGLGILVVLVVVGLLTGLQALLIPLGVILGLLVTMILFGRFAQAAHLEHFEPRRKRYLMTGTGGYFTRVGRWLRESF